jgi:hypothetical protein
MNQENLPLPNSESRVENKEISLFQKDLKHVFELKPDLEKIGTMEQYAEYLKTIFPTTKIKQIVWHGGQNIPTEFRANPEGIFFTDNLQYANMYGNELSKLNEGVVNNKSQPMVINIENPFYPTLSISTRPSHKDIYFNPKDTPPGHDGVRGKDAYAETLGDSIAVFNPEQIHPLGSKIDVEKFKEFIESKKQD